MRLGGRSHGRVAGSGRADEELWLSNEGVSSKCLQLHCNNTTAISIGITSGVFFLLELLLFYFINIFINLSPL